MKNIYSNILKFNNSNLKKIVKYLKKGGLVGIPTETVYGLAGNAYSDTTVKKIYQIKKRPSKNPLIIHYYSLAELEKDAILNKIFFKLYKKFCPGPITFVLRKKHFSNISVHASSKLKTIAVRFPDHFIIKKILKKIPFPLAIPSANKSGGVSPTSPIDVADEFKKKLKFIINGGSCKIGLESTVVDLTGKLKILRPGYISGKKIGQVIHVKVKLNKNSKKIKSPGMLKKHYSPDIPMKLNQKKSGKDNAFITFGKNYKKTRHTFNLSKKSNLNEAAKNLYKTFRKIKKMKYKKISVVKIPNRGIGIAINDRLKHAAR
jgi:L-threonylcarbamoyladenylate synthase